MYSEIKKCLYFLNFDFWGLNNRYSLLHCFFFQYVCNSNKQPELKKSGFCHMIRQIISYYEIMYAVHQFNIKNHSPKK